jgi:restriction endonuclease S subunit
MRHVELKDIYDIFQGIAFARLRDDSGDSVRVVQTRNLNYLEVSGEVEVVPLNRSAQLRLLRAGDVLINLKSVPVRASVATEDDIGSIASSNIAVLTTKLGAAEALNPIYLVGLLRSRYMTDALSSHMGGESISTLNLRTLRTLPVPVPSHDKQRALSTAFRALERYVVFTGELVEAHTERLEVTLSSYLGGSHEG